MNNTFRNLKLDFLIIGGGVVGMTTARELAIRGFSIGLFDKGKLGLEASWAAGGILSSMRPWSESPDSFELSSQGKMMYADFVTELKEQTGIDAEYYISGLLMVNSQDINQARQWASHNRIPFSKKYKDYSAKIQLPAEKIFFPEIAQVRVPRLLKALHASLLKLNVTIFENMPVTEISITENRCEYIMAGGNRYYADNFIITTGAWSGQILGMGKNSGSVPIKPVLGQMLCVKFPEQQLDTMVLDGERYFIPRKDGHVLIGSTMENVGFNKKTTQLAKRELMDWACALWPEMTKAEFTKHWSGLRPATEHGKPFLGQLMDYENIYINAGHFRKGILQAPVCAKKIVDIICKESRYVDRVVFDDT